VWGAWRGGRVYAFEVVNKVKCTRHNAVGMTEDEMEAAA